MRKFWKIFGITIGSLVGLLLMVLLAACYIIFTPKRLTPIVNQVADSLLLCEHRLDKVELTFFSTFPNFGVEIDGLYLINAVDGALNDTVLAVPEVVAAVNVKKALHGDIVIKRFLLKEAQANLYIAGDGTTNFDILNLPERTAEEESSADGWQLKSISWREALEAEIQKVSFVDDKDSLYASLGVTQLTLSGSGGNDPISLLAQLTAKDVCLTIGEESYAQQVALRLALPIRGNYIDSLRVDGTELMLNEFAIQLDGTVGTPSWALDTVNCDLHLRTNDWQISRLMALLPPSVRDLWPKEVQADGKLRLDAHVYGQYDSLSMPLADARLRLMDAAGQYTELPYYIDEMNADVELHADWNTKNLTTARLRRLYARTGETSVSAEGTVTNLLKNTNGLEIDDPLATLVADIQIDLAEADYWIKEEGVTNRVRGKAIGHLQAKTRLSQVTNQQWSHIGAAADLRLKGLDVVWQDSILAQAEEMKIALQTQPKGKKNTLFATADIDFRQLHADLLSSQLNAHIPNGTLTGEIELNYKDTSVLPIIAVAMDLGALTASMDTLYVHALAPKGKVALKTSKRHARPQAEAQIAAESLQFNMGQWVQAKTDKIDVAATVSYNEKGENVLLQWNPRLRVALENGKAKTDWLETPLFVPQIQFNYSNREVKIDTSRIVLGNSDFNLAGDVKGLGKWLKHQGQVVGELRFTSEMTDVNELMEIINRFNQQNGHVESDEEGMVAADNSGADNEAINSSESDQMAQDVSGAFMVPTDVDLTLLTQIKTARFADETLTNLGGRMYIRDSKLILEEMGFVCEAAKMQLTAMYKTPRHNHLYAGADFHLMDIDIANLIRMIPMVDSLVPMLKQFEGKAQFHIALETYLTEHYQPKRSTMRGACSIEGKDMVLIPGDIFKKASKLLMFSPKTRNNIDSISVQMALYKTQVTVYPFCLSIDKYMAAIGGTHYMDMNYNYHASLLKPVYLGVDVKGNLDDMDVKLAPVRYAEDFHPLFHRDADDRSEELRKIISESLKKSVKEP